MERGTNLWLGFFYDRELAKSMIMNKTDNEIFIHKYFALNRPSKYVSVADWIVAESEKYYLLKRKTELTLN